MGQLLPPIWTSPLHPASTSIPAEPFTLRGGRDRDLRRTRIDLSASGDHQDDQKQNAL